MSMWHGTGYYNNGLCHVGIALLLSNAIQQAWKDYETRATNDELDEDDLLWYLSEDDL